ncbi:MAG TPA: 16S rRNA (cytidine(1402)-2'-O)-methyltransferase [Acidimicrobiales bacterium]|nr:16S rRNA (cytidine(1402)-2'-O)-methyltransferase [Acidimicrobiales bacterium]
MAGRLVVVGTPIGNLEDMSPRAARALREATAIYCEDTRRTRGLLSALGIPAPRLSRLDAHTERSVAERVADEVEAGEIVALVSDAGMPCISDPGADLVKVVAGRGLPTEVVPGPSAVSAALALSGLPASQYRFAGFLPRKGRQRSTSLAAVGSSEVTVVIYEAANRVAATLADLLAVCGPDRSVVLARELTKMHEEVWRGTLDEAVSRVEAIEPRGEYVMVVAAAPAVSAVVEDHDLVTALSEKLAAGADRKTAVAAVAAALGVPKRRVYDLALDLREGR